MKRLEHRYTVFALLLIISLVLSGCLGGAGAGAGTYTVTGTVIEADTGNPVPGAVVTVASKRTSTDARGQFELSGIPSGSHTLQARLRGYENRSFPINVHGDTALTVELASNLPILNNSAIEVNPPSSDGTICLPSLYYQAGWDELFGAAGWDSEIVDASAYVNGQPIPSWFDEYSHQIYGRVPLRFGENTFQLRVWDEAGFTRTSALYTVNLDMSRLDLYLLLTWDGHSDLDLHMFKRDAAEENQFDGESDDRHVYYFNTDPSDFGSEASQNPVHEWDGGARDRWESIILPELTEGDYHIWIYPWTVREATKAELRVVLNAASENPTVKTYSLSFHVPDEKAPSYVVTVRVQDDTIAFETVPPTELE